MVFVPVKMKFFTLDIHNNENVTLSDFYPKIESPMGDPSMDLTIFSLKHEN